MRRKEEAVDEGVNKKGDIAKEFGILPNTLSTIFKNQRNYEDEDMPNKTKRYKSAEFMYVDECVLKWLRQFCEKNVPILRLILKEKDIQLAESLGHQDFHNFQAAAPR